MERITVNLELYFFWRFVAVLLCNYHEMTSNEVAFIIASG